MLTIPNYEMVVSSLPTPEGKTVPVLLLSFAWEDTGLINPQHAEWLPAASQLQTHEKGLHVTLDGFSVLFPLVESGQGSHVQGLDRSVVLDLIAQHGFLYVCALDADGTLLASVGFVLSQ